MKLFSLVLTLLFSVIAQAQVAAHHIDSQGREWKRLDTTKNISLSYLQQNCQPVCATSSTLNGYTWANQEQVRELLLDFSASIPTVDYIEGFFAAGEFMSRMGVTYAMYLTYQTSEQSIGVTASVDANNQPIYGFASASHSGAGITASGGLGLSTLDASQILAKGAFLIKTSEVPPVTCQYNNQTYAIGATVNSYLSAQVPYGSTCQTVQRTCLATGQFSGAIIPSCQVSPGASCTYNGQVIPHGGSVSGFLPQTSSKSSCTPVVRYCNNGSIIGSIVPTCTAKPEEKCRIKKGVLVCEKR